VGLIYDFGEALLWIDGIRQTFHIKVGGIRIEDLKRDIGR